MTCSLMGLFLYYPVATFMSSNLQFQNKLLDLKMNPTFLVIMNQIMLLISGLTCFYSDEIIVILVFNTVSMLFMGILSIFWKPCLVKEVNIWIAVKFLLVAMVNIKIIIDNRWRCNDVLDKE